MIRVVETLFKQRAILNPYHMCSRCELQTHDGCVQVCATLANVIPFRMSAHRVKITVHYSGMTKWRGDISERKYSSSTRRGFAYLNGTAAVHTRYVRRVGRCRLHPRLQNVLVLQCSTCLVPHVKRHSYVPNPRLCWVDALIGVRVYDFNRFPAINRRTRSGTGVWLDALTSKTVPRWQDGCIVVTMVSSSLGRDDWKAGRALLGMQRYLVSYWLRI